MLKGVLKGENFSGNFQASPEILAQVMYIHLLTEKMTVIVYVQVYTRLHKLGLCISHKAATLVFKKLSENHDRQVFDWMNRENLCSDFALQAQEVSVAPPSPCFILQGDNYDTTVHVRDMRMDNQNKSLHYFNTYAAKDRPEFCKMDSTDNSSPTDIMSAPKSTFLPTMVDCKAVRDNYIVLVARVLTEYLTFLQPLKQCVPSHVLHQYSSLMSEKSEIVSDVLYDSKLNRLCHVLPILHCVIIRILFQVPLGVIPKNENKRDEMMEVLEILHKYVPTHGDEVLEVSTDLMSQVYCSFLFCFCRLHLVVIS